MARAFGLCNLFNVAHSMQLQGRATSEMRIAFNHQVSRYTNRRYTNRRCVNRQYFINCVVACAVVMAGLSTTKRLQANPYQELLSQGSNEFLNELKLLIQSNPPVDPEAINMDLDFGIKLDPVPSVGDESQINKIDLIPPSSFNPARFASSKNATELAPKLTPAEAERKSNLQRCLAVYYTRQVDADVLRPWSIMHGLIGFGEETSVIHKGQRHNAVDYLCSNGVGDDRRILYVENGELRARVGVGVQGHDAQLLAMLAQSNVPYDHPIKVDGQSFTVKDLIDWEMKSCRSGSELTFKLLGLSYYISSQATWKNAEGQEWTLTRLLKEELAQPVNEGACGGSHRLMAISYAVMQRRDEDLPIDGNWFRADKFIKDFQKFVWSHQHQNGSFSTDWFRSKSFSGEVQKSLYTTGHILEWLAYSLSDEELEDPRLVRAVDFVLTLMLSAPNYDLPVGPRGHAIRALRIYQQRVFEKTDYAQLMSDEALVNNNPQNAGGSAPQRISQPVQNSPPGFRRARFGRRR